MRRSLFILLAACGLIGLLAVGMMAYLRLRSAAPQLPEAGTVVESVAGVSAGVEVAIDGHGVPHVLAQTDSDAWFAQGYLHARERFYEMELARRRGSGRLAEVLGVMALDEDRRARTWRLAAIARRQATQLKPGERQTLEAYAAGVNAALRRFGRWIAPEVWMLEVDPEPWRAEDSLVILAHFGLQLSQAMGAELERSVQLGRLGKMRAVDLWGWTPDEAARWIPDLPPATRAVQADDAIVVAPAAVTGVSWAVGPRRVAGANSSLVAAAIESRLEMPPRWYAVHLSAPGLQVAGASLPGVPGVLIGHTERLAWAVTPAMVDDQDLLVLKLDASQARYAVDGGWQPLRTITERIVVRGWKSPELLKVRLAEMGPLVRNTPDEVLVLEWSGQYGSSAVGAFLSLNRAQSVTEVAPAFEGVAAPSLSLIAADRSGHILHRVVGLIPHRDRGVGRLLAPAAAGRWTWSGFLSSAGNPQSLDPAESFLVAAGQDFFAEGEYPPHLRYSGEFVPPWRARRVRWMLSARRNWDTEGCLRLLEDTASGRARALLLFLRGELERHPGRTAKELLAWDGRMEPGSLAAHLYSRFLLELGGAIGSDEAWASTLESSPVGPEEVLRIVAGGIDESWWDDVRTAEREEMSTIIARALDQVDEHRLMEPWGRVHTAYFPHPFLHLPMLGAMLGRAWSAGPFATGGDDSTVNACAWDQSLPFEVSSVPSLRFVADTLDWDRSFLTLAGGQSGQPWSRHYADQLQGWRTGAPTPLPFSPEAVERATRSRLRLLPEASTR